MPNIVIGSRYSFFVLCVVIAAFSACATNPAPEHKLAKTVKKIPSKKKCIPLGVMYGRATSKENALYDLRLNTANSGGTHVIVTDSNTNNKDEFTLAVPVTSNYVLGDGYTCPEKGQ